MLIDPISAFLVANGLAAGGCTYVIYKARQEEAARVKRAAQAAKLSGLRRQRR